MGKLEKTMIFTLGLLLLLSGIILIPLMWGLTRGTIGDIMAVLLGVVVGTLISILGIRIMSHRSEYQDNEPPPPNIF